MNRRLLPFIAGLVLIVAAAFLPAVTNGHLQLDDWGYVYGCPFVACGLTWKGLAAAFTDFGHGGIWMPLTYLSYACDISLFGRGWAAHHAVNVALHVANTVLILILLRALLVRLAPARAAGAAFAAFAAALLWALHPQRAEAVTWVASRKEELWTFFALLSCAAWARFADHCSPGAWCAAFAAFVLAALAKPTAVVLPVLLILLERFLTGRRVRAGALVPFFVASFFVGLVAIASQVRPTDAETVAVFDAPFSWRLLNGGVSAGLDLLHTVWPVGLHVDYRAIPGGWPLGGALGLAVLALALAAPWCIRSREVRRACLFALAWYLLALLPVLGVIGFTGDKAYADRYTYLPSVAFAFLIARGVSACAVRCRFLAAALAVLAAAEIVPLVPLVRSFAYDDLAWGRVLGLDPDHWRAQRIVGNQMCADGRTDEGVALLLRSLAGHASRRTADSLAYVLAHRGKPGDFDCVRRLGASVAARPSSDRAGMMSDALGVVALREGRDDLAIRYLLASLAAPQRQHRRDHSLLNLGLALANAGRDDEARRTLAKAAESPLPVVSARAREALAALAVPAPRPRLSWQ